MLGVMESRVCLTMGTDTKTMQTMSLGLIKALRLPPPILIGHSMGGMTAAVVGES